MLKYKSLLKALFSLVVSLVLMLLCQPNLLFNDTVASVQIIGCVMLNVPLDEKD